MVQIHCCDYDVMKSTHIADYVLNTNVCWWAVIRLLPSITEGCYLVWYAVVWFSIQAAKRGLKFYLDLDRIFAHSRM